MITITLDQIKKHNPCEDGWEKLTSAMGADFPSDQPFPLSRILDTNGLADALWALQCLPEHANLWRKFAVWCARQVQRLMTDPRSIDALGVAWRHSDGLATDGELAAARAAACGAARAAAWGAARAAACGAARGDQSSQLRKILDAGEWVE